MLNALRSRAGGLFSKLLMVFLAASFVLWGVGDIAGRGSNRTIAQIGSTTITQAEFEAEFNQKINGFRRMLGANYSPDLIKGLGIETQVLNEMINRAALTLETEAFGIRISDEVVMDTIRNAPSFQDDNGKFDKTTFINTLRNLGITEKTFIDRMKQDTANNLLLQSVAGTHLVPTTLLNMLYAARNETRMAEILTISEKQVGTLPAPDEATLEAYHNNNADLFTAPEMRTISYTTISNKNAASAQKKDDKADGIYELTTALEEDLASGSTLEEVAEKFKLTIKTIGPVGADGKTADGKIAPNLPVYKDFLKTGFSQSEGIASDLLLAENNIYYIIRTDSITDAQLRPLSEVREQVISAWKKAEARNRLQALASEIAVKLVQTNDKESIIRDYKLPVSASGKITRSSAKFANSTTPPAEFFQEIFVRKIGESTGAYPLVNGNYVIGILKQTIPAGGTGSKSQIDMLKDEVARSTEQELAQQYLLSLRSKYSVTIHEDALPSPTQ